MKKSELQNIIREEINGILKEISEDVDAIFYSWWDVPGHGKLAFYNVINPKHELYKSTVTIDTLKKNHLKFNPPPTEEK